MYDHTVHFVETDNFREAIRRFGLTITNKFTAEDSLGVTFCAENNEESFIFLYPRTGISTLVHECWHVIYNIFTHRNISFDDETVAYHLDFLVKMATRFYGLHKAEGF